MVSPRLPVKRNEQLFSSFNDWNIQKFKQLKYSDMSQVALRKKNVNSKEFLMII